jgi:GntR family transcriptional regulator of arabinose operon
MLDIIEGCSGFMEETGEELFILCSQEKQSLENRVVQSILDKGAKGLIVFPVNGETHSRELFKLALNNFPIVFIDRILTGFDISSVSTDHAASACDATDFLIKKGRKNIGIILPSPSGTSSLTERLRGYEKAFTINGLPIRMRERLFVERGKTCLEKILEFFRANPQLDAVISIGDKIGLDLYRAVRELKIQVPAGLALVFFDNEYEAFKDLLPFTPAMVVQQAYQIGYEAARILCSLVKNPAAGLTKLLIPAKLIPGQSIE